MLRTSIPEGLDAQSQAKHGDPGDGLQNIPGVRLLQRFPSIVATVQRKNHMNTVVDTLTYVVSFRCRAGDIGRWSDILVYMITGQV